MVHSHNIGMIGRLSIVTGSGDTERSWRACATMAAWLPRALFLRGR